MRSRLISLDKSENGGGGGGCTGTMGGCCGCVPHSVQQLASNSSQHSMLVNRNIMTHTQGVTGLGVFQFISLSFDALFSVVCTAGVVVDVLQLECD